MAEVSSLTSNGTVEVLAWHSSEISNFYGLSGFNLLLSLLLLFGFAIYLLEMTYLSLDCLDTLLMLESHLDDRYG